MSRAIVRRACALVLVALVTVSCGGVRVSAQEVQAPISPDPAACTIEPRTLEDLGALWDGTPYAEPAQVTEVAILVGEEADAATRAAATETILGVMACLNGPDMGRAFAYMTESMLRTQFGWALEGIAQGQSWVTELQEPMPAELRMTVLAVGPVMRLADGRVGALITFHDPSSDTETKITALYLVLVLQGPIWQIDEVVSIEG